VHLIPNSQGSANEGYYYAHDGQAYGPLSLAELNQFVSAGRLSADVMVAASGDSDWVPLRTLLASENSAGQSSYNQQPPRARSQKSVFSFLDVISGLPSAKPLPWRQIARKTFASNSEADAESIFLSGSNEEAVPWVFSRILIGGLLAMGALLWALETFGNLKLIPGFFFIGCVTVPLATLALIVELSTSSRLNGYHVAKAVVIGGLLSIIFTLIFNELPVVSNFTFTPMMAGPVEETAKLFAVIFIARNWRRARHVQDGIVLGSAVGAGFAMIETAGYIFERFIIIHEGGVFLDWHGALGTLTDRAILSPFTHVLWTAVVAGALWYGSKNSESKFSGFFSPAFLRIFIFIVGLHAFWNSPFFLPFADAMSAVYGKYLLVGISGWYILLQLRGSEETSAQ
jgi:RsiW-degrading membrane proteinase PrsW (M82 family)